MNLPKNAIPRRIVIYINDSLTRKVEIVQNGSMNKSKTNQDPKALNIDTLGFEVITSKGKHNESPNVGILRAALTQRTQMWSNILPVLAQYDELLKNDVLVECINESPIFSCAKLVDSRLFALILFCSVEDASNSTSSDCDGDKQDGLSIEDIFFLSESNVGTSKPSIEICLSPDSSGIDSVFEVGIFNFSLRGKILVLNPFCLFW